jgi:hypothetical protein
MTCRYNGPLLYGKRTDEIGLFVWFWPIYFSPPLVFISLSTLKIFIIIYSLCDKTVENAVAELVQALRYKPEGRGFHSRWDEYDFLMTYYLRSPCGPGFDSASNANEYRGIFPGDKGGRCVRLTTLPLSCADCLASLEASNSWSYLTVRLLYSKVHVV